MHNNRCKHQLLFTVTIWFLSLGVTMLWAQKSYKVLNRPVAYLKPAENVACDVLDRNFSNDYPWVVISDRAENTTYTKPNQGATELQRLDFKEGPFYVAEREGSWLHIVKGRSTVEASGRNNKRYKIEGDDFGWVPMCNMLLWTEPLYTTEPRIPKRTLILNRLDAIQDPTSGDQAPIFQHPTRADMKGEPINMFDFYSVLKVEGSGDNQRYLIANDRNLSRERPSSRDIDLTIVGWVPANRCTNWDTRIALECNFDEAAFNERKANSNLQVVGYNQMGHARSHKESGSIGPDPYWQSDPVTLPASSLVAPDLRRKLGSVTRIPLLDVVGSGDGIYKSGVISGVELEGGKELQETDLATECKKLQDAFAPKNNVNVFFVVQGTKNMASFRQQILDAIPQFPVEFGSADVKLKYGALVYRNVFDGKAGTGGSPEGKLMDLFPLSSSESEFRQFLQQAEMNNWEGDPETNYPAFAHSLSEGINKAGFNEKETNVIIVIGSHGDFQYSAVQRRAYPEYSKSMDDLVQEVSAIQGQVFFVAAEIGGRSGRNYLDMGHRLASGTAKQLYNSTYKYNRKGQQLPSPNIDQLPDEIIKGSLLIEDTGIPNGGLYFPAMDNRNESIKDQVRAIARVTRQQVSELQQAVDDLCVKGQGEGNSIIAQLVAKEFADMGVPEEYFQKRYQFYHEAFIPKKIKGSSYPTMKSVVFMSSEDLFLFVNELKLLVTSPDDPRQGVVDAYQELVQSLTGNSLLGSKRRKFKQDLSQYSIKDVNEIMFGMQEGYMDCPPEKEWICEVNLGNILDEDLTPESDVERLRQNFEDIVTNLESTVLAPDYPYVYVTKAGDYYYWIPLEDMY